MVGFYERYSISSFMMLLMTVAESIVLYIFLTHLWDRLIGGQFTSRQFEIRVSEAGKWYFGALACIIALSSGLGKLGFLEVFNHNLITMIFYSLTEYLVVRRTQVQDTGRTISLFAFAGTVSLAMSFFLRKEDANCLNKVPSTRGYALALVGMGLCWVYFCAFNTAYAVGYQKTLAFFNTWASEAASTLTVFALSYAVQGKLDPFCIIFSSLSGGIAVGCIADLIKNPAAAIFVGILAGTLTFFANWSNLLGSFTEDSTGLGNLSLINGVVGSVMSSIIINFYNHDGGYT